ncbi:MAG: hypothetical protein ACYDHU_00290 [Acidimicrobiales bacterium]
MDYLLRRLARSALRRARSGQHWAWWIVALALFGIHRLRRRDTDIQTLTVRPGDRFTLTAIDPTSPFEGPGA